MAIAQPTLDRAPLWRRILGLPGSKKLLNRLASTALELADIILGSIPGAEAISEVKEFTEAAIKAQTEPLG
jgi:hypothetical protein